MTQGNGPDPDEIQEPSVYTPEERAASEQEAFPKGKRAPLGERGGSGKGTVWGVFKSVFSADKPSPNIGQFASLPELSITESIRRSPSGREVDNRGILGRTRDNISLGIESVRSASIIRKPVVFFSEHIWQFLEHIPILRGIMDFARDLFRENDVSKLDFSSRTDKDGNVTHHSVLMGALNEYDRGLFDRERTKNKRIRKWVLGDVEKKGTLGRKVVDQNTGETLPFRECFIWAVGEPMQEVVAQIAGNFGGFSDNPGYARNLELSIASNIGNQFMRHLSDLRDRGKLGGDGIIRDIGIRKRSGDGVFEQVMPELDITKKDDMRLLVHSLFLEVFPIEPISKAKRDELALERRAKEMARAMVASIPAPEPRVAVVDGEEDIPLNRGRGNNNDLPPGTPSALGFSDRVNAIASMFEAANISPEQFLDLLSGIGGSREITGVKIDRPIIVNVKDGNTDSEKSELFQSFLSNLSEHDISELERRISTFRRVIAGPPKSNVEDLGKTTGLTDDTPEQAAARAEMNTQRNRALKSKRKRGGDDRGDTTPEASGGGLFSKLRSMFIRRKPPADGSGAVSDGVNHEMGDASGVADEPEGWRMDGSGASTSTVGEERKIIIEKLNTLNNEQKAAVLDSAITADGSKVVHSNGREEEISNIVATAGEAWINSAKEDLRRIEAVSELADDIRAINPNNEEVKTIIGDDVQDIAPDGSSSLEGGKKTRNLIHTLLSQHDEYVEQVRQRLKEVKNSRVLAAAAEQGVTIAGDGNHTDTPGDDGDRSPPGRGGGRGK